MQTATGAGGKVTAVFWNRQASETLARLGLTGDWASFRLPQIGEDQALVHFPPACQERVVASEIESEIGRRVCGVFCLDGGVAECASLTGSSRATNRATREAGQGRARLAEKQRPDAWNAWVVAVKQLPS